MFEKGKIKIEFRLGRVFWTLTVVDIGGCYSRRSGDAPWRVTASTNRSVQCLNLDPPNPRLAAPHCFSAASESKLTAVVVQVSK